MISVTMLTQPRLDLVKRTGNRSPRGLRFPVLSARLSMRRPCPEGRHAIDRKSGDAGTASVAGTVDAAVTWRPWSSKATATKFGKVLADPVVFAIRTESPCRLDA